MSDKVILKEDMFCDLLCLAEQENEPNRYAHSEEFDKLYSELYGITMIVDVLEKLVDCSLQEILDFIVLLKKYYYVDITGKLMARTIWDNIKLNEEELYKINHIFNKIKDKSE